jgi:hypothetical protein
MISIYHKMKGNFLNMHRFCFFSVHKEISTKLAGKPFIQESHRIVVSSKETRQMDFVSMYIMKCVVLYKESTFVHRWHCVHSTLEYTYFLSATLHT